MLHVSQTSNGSIEIRKERLNMGMNSEPGNTVLRLGLLLDRTADVFARCEDSVFREYGLTAEQFAVLAAVKSRGCPLRPVDLAA
jgi:hypothetical protein